MDLLSALADAIQQATNSGEALLKILRASNNPASEDASQRSIRRELADAASRLMQLATAPTEYLDQLAGNYQNVMCLRWLVNLDILQHIPVDGAVPYGELSGLARVPERQLRSVCRMAITHNFLSEPTLGCVAHNANSLLLVTDDSFMNWAKFMTNYSVPTAFRFPDATQRWGLTEAKNETAFQLAMGIEVPFFEHLRQDKGMNAMFSSYMKNVASTAGISFDHLVDGFDWATLPEGAKVVDVGGSRGHASHAIANAFPSLEFIVQDLPETIKDNQQEPAQNGEHAIGSRVRFMPHDFFQQQPVDDADVYLLRMIIHDWPDGEAAKILIHLRQALKKPGARILIMDTILPESGTIPALQERQLRVRDLTMMQVFNAKERELESWRRLIHDVGLEVLAVKQPPGSVMGILTLGLPARTAVTNGELRPVPPTVTVPEHINGLFSAGSDFEAHNISKQTGSPGQVLIVGGGIGGLCLAQGLKKAGVKFSVFERDLSEAYRPQGYRLKLEDDSVQALQECLPKDIFAAFQTSCAITTLGETDFNPHTGSMTKSRAGGGLGGSQGLRAASTVDRATFRSVLMQGIEEQIFFGKDIFYYNTDEERGTVTVQFRDGSRAEGGLLVGADGSRSRVRKQYLPTHEVVDTGAICIYGKTPMSRDFLERFPEKGLRWMTAVTDQAPLIQSILIGDSPLTLLAEPIRFDTKSRGHMQLPEDYVYWVLIGRKEIFAEAETANKRAFLERDADESARQSLALTAEWDSSLRSLFELQDTEQCSTLSVVSQVPKMQPWAPHKLVTVIGDAIHPMSPCGGVGANTALRDAAELVKTFAGGHGLPTEEQIGTFEEGLRQRAFRSIMRAYVGSQKMFQQAPFDQCAVVDA